MEVNELDKDSMQIMFSDEKHALAIQALRQASYVKTGIIATTYQDDYIARGNGFQIQRRITGISTTTNYKAVLDLSGVDSNKNIFILPIVFFATGGPVYIKTYNITSYTGGTSFPINKLNYLPSNTIVSQAVAKHGITSTDVAGDDLREYELGATGNPQQVNRSGAASGSTPLIVPPGTIICLEIDNNYSAAIDFTLGLIWYEIGAIA